MRLGSVTSVSLGALALAAGLIGAAPALAQERPQQGASTVTEVVVTAERRDQNLQRAAVAANVLNERQLEARAVHTVDDLEAVTPSLTVSSGGQSNYMNIRGVGKNDNAGNTTSAVPPTVTASARSPASPTASPTTTFPQSRCCAGRRGPLSARTPPAGRSSSTPAIR